MAPNKRKSAAPKPTEGFTPERFEKELKDLAAKAKNDTWSKHAGKKASAYLKSALLLFLIGVYSNASQLAMSPVYGSIPTSIWHSKLMMAACFVGWSGNLALRRQLPVDPAHLLPLIALWIPVVQYNLLKMSGLFTAHWGPLVTETLTLFPLVVISVSCVATYLDDAGLDWLPQWIGDAVPGLGSWLFYKFIEVWSGNYIQSHMGETFFQTRVGLEMLLAAAYGVFAPSKLLLYAAVPALLHTAFFNDHAMTPAAFKSLNATLARENWVLLDRRESVTGYISVLESLDQGFRVLRCDHSLLGGEWVKFAGTARVAEPVYAVFAMLEAVRLVEVPDRILDSAAKALVIGLGIGTTPSALVAHGIDTTVVEIDPVVYEFAEKYFQLPSNHTKIIADAVTYTADLAKADKRFDYIVHDVFTGGAEPIPLFTLEFLEGLATLLKPDGVIAINYAGDFMLPPARLVVETIREVFPVCRIFREEKRPDEEVIKKEGRDFTNMVIFCQKSGKGLKFRSPVQADYLGSRARNAFLVPVHEVKDSDFTPVTEKDGGILTSNNTLRLVKWQQKSALSHWEVMRIVLPKKVWENW